MNKRSLWLVSFGIAGCLQAEGVSPPASHDTCVDIAAEIVSAPSTYCPVEKEIAIRLYQAESFTLSWEAAVEGCRVWEQYFDVTCTAVDSPEEANLALRQAPCDDRYRAGGLGLDEHELPALGITLYPDCWTYGSGNERYVSEVVRVPMTSHVVAHEIGHVLGLGHIPDTCDGSGTVRVHPTYGPLCGPALMNLSTNASPPRLSLLDVLYYEMLPEEQRRYHLRDSLTCEAPPSPATGSL